MNDRIERLRRAMEEERLDALLVSSPIDDTSGTASANRRYISGFTGSTGYVLVGRRSQQIAVDFRYVEQAERECAPLGFEVFRYQGPFREWFPRFLRHSDLLGARIGVSSADISLAGFETIRKALLELPWGQRPELGPASPLIERQRRQKDADEVTALQRAIDVADAAFGDAIADLEPGTTEVEVAARVADAVRRHGAEGVSFETIVAGGAWAAMPHASPRHEPIAAGQPLVIDMGARVDGYCSDLTRTIVLGQPSARFEEIYAIVFEAQRNAIERVEAGMTGVQAHELAHSVIQAAGYGDCFGHGLGHGVGLQVHEDPYLGKSSTDTLEEGNIFTIEPGIYIPGWGGVRIEDVVVLEHGRARVLSHAPKLMPGGLRP